MSTDDKTQTPNPSETCQGYPIITFSVDVEDQPVHETTPRNIAELEARRETNRLAARRSRQRKREYVAYMESKVKKLTSEKNRWEAKANVYHDMMVANGLSVPIPEASGSNSMGTSETFQLDGGQPTAADLSR